jgi:hypothetical protein
MFCGVSSETPLSIYQAVLCHMPEKGNFREAEQWMHIIGKWNETSYEFVNIQINVALRCRAYLKIGGSVLRRNIVADGVVILMVLNEIVLQLSFQLSRLTVAFQ